MSKISLTSANGDYCLNLSHDYAKYSETEISNSPTSDGLLCHDVSHNLPGLHNISTMHISPTYQNNDTYSTLKLYNDPRFPLQNLKCPFSNTLRLNARKFMPNSTKDNGINTLNTLNPYALCFFPKKHMKYILNPSAIIFNPMVENVSNINDGPPCQPPMNFTIAGSRDCSNIVNDSLADSNYDNSEPISQNFSLPSSPITPHGDISTDSSYLSNGQDPQYVLNQLRLSNIIRSSKYKFHQKQI